MVLRAASSALWLPACCRHCGCFLFLFRLLLLLHLIMLTASIHDAVPPPKFLPGPSDVTARQGDVAILPCAVKHLGTKQVAWRRIEADDFLTIGEMTWIGDDTIAVEHSEGDTGTSHWNLVIDKVTPQDAGVYECQVTSKLGFNKRVTLKVVGPPISEPVISIEGKRYVNLDDKIHLICNASGGSRIPEDIDWFKDGDMIDSFKYPHVLIDTYPSLKQRALLSELLIERARRKDSGEYVCRSSRNNIVNMKVTVLRAEKPNNKRRGTAAQPDSLGGGAPAVGPSAHSWLHVLLALLLLTLTLLFRPPLLPS
ncbi:zwei Ig domain protein zig-8-like isoform X2 [Babylonia areolata]|uniref:zwei Ig domain protein zig-8-like isoform X2 n=1 Tax=Babylonia areolata TaxID=304850 RepID=UPI003FD5CA68